MELPLEIHVVTLSLQSDCVIEASKHGTMLPCTFGYASYGFVDLGFGNCSCLERDCGNECTTCAFRTGLWLTACDHNVGPCRLDMVPYVIKVMPI